MAVEIGKLVDELDEDSYDLYLADDGYSRLWLTLCSQRDLLPSVWINRGDPRTTGARAEVVERFDSPEGQAKVADLTNALRLLLHAASSRTMTFVKPDQHPAELLSSEPSGIEPPFTDQPVLRRDYEES
jgi:hypothetical protein